MLLPEGPVVGEAHLGRQSVALPVERAQPLRRHALHPDVAQRPHRQCADHRGRAERLANGGGDLAAGRSRGDPYPGHGSTVADAVAKLLRHAQRHRGRALADPLALPDVVVVEAMRPGRGLLAQVREQRRSLHRLSGQRQHGNVAGAHRAGRGAAVTHPRADREAIELVRIRMRPGIVGVHRARQHRELLLDVLVAGSVGVRQPGYVVADHGVVGEHPGLLAGQVGERRHQRQPQLGHQAGVGRLEGTDHLSTELHQAAVRE
jgi:hypothetical protein